MASTYSTNLRLEKMAKGDQSGTWGATLNTQLDLIEAAVSGVVSVAHTNAASITLTATNGATDQSRQAVVQITGALTAKRQVIVPSVTNLYVISNATTGGFAITIKTASGTGVDVTAGTKVLVYIDASNNAILVGGGPGDLDAMAQPATVASAATVDLAAAAAVYVNITGSVAITSFGTATAGMFRFVHFTDAGAVLTHSSNLILPGSANITSEAFDTAVFVAHATTQWRCIAYTRRDGSPAPGLKVQSSGFDVTAGRLLTVGAFGLGMTAAGYLITPTDLDDYTKQVTGFYSVANPNGLPAGTYVVYIHRHNTLNIFQRAMAVNVGHKVYERYLSSTDPSRAWTKVLETNDIQSSVLDPTAGKLMTVGAFGLGAIETTNNISVTELNDWTALETGMYRIATPGSGLPSATYAVLIQRTNAGTYQRLACINVLGLSGGNYERFLSASLPANPWVRIDNEEGTWTPTLFGATTAGTPTYTQQNGYYRRVGREVHATLYMVLTLAGSAGGLRIGGLPFTQLNNTAARSVMTTVFYGGFTNLPAETTNFGGFIQDSTNIYLYRNGTVMVTAADTGGDATTLTIYGNVSYPIS